MELFSAEGETSSKNPFINNKYTKWYYQIINNARIRVLQDNVYYELHHIIPICFYVDNRSNGKTPGWIRGDANDENNLIKLTAREHFICHWLLTKMTSGESYFKMERALSGMRMASKGQIRVLNSIHYERIRKADNISKLGRPGAMKGKIPWNKGLKMSAISRHKMSVAKKGQAAHNKGKPHPNNGKNVNVGLHKNKKWWNNSFINIRSEFYPGTGWIRGRIVKK